jgi:FixJ family two-component response regulator
VLDVRMPGMSGIELHRQLAASGSKVPVIFITSHGCHDARSQALSHGAVAHLTKPFSQDELLQAVRAGLKSNSS